MYQGWKNKMSRRSSFCFMEQNCDVRGKMCKFLWLLRIEEKIEKMYAPQLHMILIAKNTPNTQYTPLFFVILLLLL